MKKIGMLLFAGLLVACNSKSKVSDQETVADNEGEVTEEVVEPGISDEVKNFTSPDLAFHMLHSKVDYVVTTTYSAEKKGEEIVQGDVTSIDTLFFDSEGRVIRFYSINKQKTDYGSTTETKFNYTPDGKFKDANSVSVNNGHKSKGKLKQKYNSKGYITETAYTEIPSNGESDYREEYTWENGLMKTSTYYGWEWVYNSTYEYDDNRLLSKKHCEFADQGEVSITDTKYSYSELDECGNWTKCTKTNEYTYAHEEFISPDDGRTKLVYDEGSTYDYSIEERQIVYQK
jgi:hypothetical protein